MRMMTASLFIAVMAITAYNEPTDYEKYLANKKSAGTTLALQVFFPGAGNAYAQQHIAKIIIYPTLYVGSLTSGLLMGNLARWDNTKKGWLISGIVSATLVNIIGTIDAIAGCEKYNTKLREKYKLVSTRDGINVVYEF